MYRRLVASVAICAMLILSVAAPALVRAQQQNRAQSGSDASPTQRLEVLRSRVEAMRRSLNGAIAGFNAQDKGEKRTADDPRTRLSGLEKETGSVLSEINDALGKLGRAER